MRVAQRDTVNIFDGIFCVLEQYCRFNSPICIKIHFTTTTLVHLVAICNAGLCVRALRARETGARPGQQNKPSAEGGRVRRRAGQPGPGNRFEGGNCLISKDSLGIFLPGTRDRHLEMHRPRFKISQALQTGF